MKTAKTKPPRTSHKTVLAFLVGVALLSLTYGNAFAQINLPTGLPPDVQTTLEDADTFTLFSVDPTPDFEHLSTNTFQGHIILGQLDVQSRGTRMDLIDALNRGISPAQKLERQHVIVAPADCFNPRHAIRAKKGDETVELLICFECGQIYITSPWATNQLFITTPDPAANFNKVLKDAGIFVAGADGVYYVNGEVAHPGPRNYFGEDITVTAAIQAAGGFTPFASHIVRLRYPGGERARVDVDKALKDPGQDAIVYPSEQIDVSRNNSF